MGNISVLTLDGDEGEGPTSRVLEVGQRGGDGEDSAKRRLDMGAAVGRSARL